MTTLKESIEPIIDKYPISYLSSASLMQFTQEKRRAMGQKSSLWAILIWGIPR
jgi:hypothetical protein